MHRDNNTQSHAEQALKNAEGLLVLIALFFSAETRVREREKGAFSAYGAFSAQF
jgi:hypothetical protein